MRTKPLSEITKTICKNLNICIKVTNTKQEDLANAIGISTASLSRFVTGKCIPKPEQLLAICEYFDISIDQLYGRCELIVLSEFEKKYFEFVINNEELVLEIKKSIDEIDLSTSIIDYIKLKIKSDSEYKNRIKELLESK